MCALCVDEPLITSVYLSHEIRPSLPISWWQESLDIMNECIEEVMHGRFAVLKGSSFPRVVCASWSIHQDWRSVSALAYHISTGVLHKDRRMTSGLVHLLWLITVFALIYSLLWMCEDIFWASVAVPPGCCPTAVDSCSRQQLKAIPVESCNPTDF